jgi:hypothetical protein
MAFRRFHIVLSYTAMSGRKRTMCMAEACDRVSEPGKCTRCCTAFCAVHIARVPMISKSACVYCCEGVCLSAMKDAVAKRKTKQAKLSKLRPKIEEFERNHLKAGTGEYEFGQRGFVVFANPVSKKKPVRSFVTWPIVIFGKVAKPSRRSGNFATSFLQAAR